MKLFILIVLTFASSSVQALTFLSKDFCKNNSVSMSVHSDCSLKQTSIASSEMISINLPDANASEKRIYDLTIWYESECEFSDGSQFEISLEDQLIRLPPMSSGLVKLLARGSEEATLSLKTSGKHVVAKSPLNNPWCTISIKPLYLIPNFDYLKQNVDKLQDRLQYLQSLNVFTETTALNSTVISQRLEQVIDECFLTENIMLKAFAAYSLHKDEKILLELQHFLGPDFELESHYPDSNGQSICEMSITDTSLTSGTIYTYLDQIEWLTKLISLASCDQHFNECSGPFNGHIENEILEVSSGLHFIATLIQDIVSQLDELASREWQVLENKLKIHLQGISQNREQRP